MSVYESKKIYIPEDVEEILIKSFPMSQSLLAFLNRKRINKVKDLSKFPDEILNEVIINSKKPFPELRHLILAIQNSENDEIVLTSTENEISNNNFKVMQCDQELSNINSSVGVIQPTVLIENLTTFINKTLTEFNKEDKLKFLGRLGGLDDLLTTAEVYYEYKKSSKIVSQDNKSVYVQFFENKVYIPEEIKGIRINNFPISKQLKHFLSKSKINLTEDFQKVENSVVKQIINSHKSPFPELRCFIIMIQHVESVNQYLSSTNKKDELPYILSVEEFIELINKFLSGLEEQERSVFLGYFGGLADGKIRKSFFTLKIINELRENFIGRFQEISKRLLKDLYNKCCSQVCPLTPFLLVYLTNNKYNIFQYSPEFYIRLFGECYHLLPILPEINKHNLNLEEEEKIIAQRIQDYLKDCFLPVSLQEVFSQTVVYNSSGEFFIKNFFKAIQSPKFNLIKTDNPNELFIELCELK